MFTVMAWLKIGTSSNDLSFFTLLFSEFNKHPYGISGIGIARCIYFPEKLY